MNRWSVALFAALFVVASPAAAQRLPTAVIPSHYALWFAPDLEKQTFRGRETIQVRLAAPTRTITLHAAEITFGVVSITAAGRTQPARVTLDAAAETATLTVPEILNAGPAAIDITTPASSTTNCAGSTSAAPTTAATPCRRWRQLTHDARSRPSTSRSTKRPSISH